MPYDSSVTVIAYVDPSQMHLNMHSYPRSSIDITIMSNSGSFFQHFCQNSVGRKLTKSQNSTQFLAKTLTILRKAQFSGKNIVFLLHKSSKMLTLEVKTQQNYKTQALNFPKTQFSGNGRCLRCRTMVE